MFRKAKRIIASWGRRFARSLACIGRWARSEALNLIRDACLVAGFLGVVKGVWMIYEPGAYIIGGAMLIYAGVPRKGGGRA